MGIELILGGISALVGIVGTFMQAGAAADAAAAQREARDVGAAQQRVESLESRRQRIREERVRRANILAASENVGTARSSGEVGAIGALSTNLSGLFGQELGRSAAAQGINVNEQRAADATQRANTIGAWTGAIQSGISGFQSVFDRRT